jgi:hypothetical protein
VIRGKKKVVWFQITMSDIFGVNIFDTFKYLSNDGDRILLAVLLLLFDAIKKFSA